MPAPLPEVCLSPPPLALTSRVLWVGFLRESGGLGVVDDGGVRVETFGHFVADDVDETFKHGLHIDVLFGACLEEFQT